MFYTCLRSDTNAKDWSYNKSLASVHHIDSDRLVCGVGIVFRVTDLCNKLGFQIPTRLLLDREGYIRPKVLVLDRVPSAYI